MRGFLGFLILAAAVIGVLAVVLAQLVLPAVVSAAILGSPALRGQAVSVRVETSLAGLVSGRIDQIVLAGNGLAEPSVTISSVDLTLVEVSILDRSFASAAGNLSGVAFSIDTSSPIFIPTAELSGSNRTVFATVDLDPATSASAIQARLRAAGLSVDGVSFADGRIDLTVAGRTVEARTVLTNSGLSLESTEFASVLILPTPATSEWRVRTATVTPAGLQIVIGISPE